MTSTPLDRRGSDAVAMDDTQQRRVATPVPTSAYTDHAGDDIDRSDKCFCMVAYEECRRCDRQL